MSEGHACKQHEDVSFPFLMNLQFLIHPCIQEWRRFLSKTATKTVASSVITSWSTGILHLVLVVVKTRLGRHAKNGKCIFKVKKALKVKEALKEEKPVCKLKASRVSTVIERESLLFLCYWLWQESSIEKGSPRTLFLVDLVSHFEVLMLTRLQFVFGLQCRLYFSV